MPDDPGMPRKTVTIDPVSVFRAMGHAARLEITRALAEREHCVSELRESIGCSWSTASQHLSVLRNAGIVESTKRGNQVVYRLALPCVATFASCLSEAAKGRQVEVRACCNES